MGVVLTSKRERNRIDVLARRSVGNSRCPAPPWFERVREATHFKPSRSRAILPRTLLREQTGQVIDARTANFINLPG
jgi:hypothetical protein